MERMVVDEKGSEWLIISVASLERVERVRRLSF
jgi:hypothetical protein